MLQEFWHVFTDPAHMAAEVASSIVIDGLFLFLIYQTLIKKYLLPRWHKQMDKEHGIEHVEQPKHVHDFKYQKYVSVMGEMFPEPQSWYECSCGEGLWTAPKRRSANVSS